MGPSLLRERHGVFLLLAISNGLLSFLVLSRLFGKNVRPGFP